MSRIDTWMPLYIADYLADTRRLSTLEHGAYLLLIMEYWRHGPLPDDDRELAAIVHIDRKTWDKEVGQSIRRFFQRQEDGLLHQKRIDTERSKTLQLSNKRREAVLQRRDRSPSNVDQATNKGSTIVDQLNTHAGVAVQSQLPEERAVLRTGADAPLTTDARVQLWSVGLSNLARMTGKPERACRTLLGRWAKEARDDCAMLNAIIADCDGVRPGDPIAWISAGITARMKPPDKFAWLDAASDPASPSTPFDLEMTADEHGTFRPQ
jgi:uncharacterized protein YdaU (DUF1376 family)